MVPIAKSNEASIKLIVHLLYIQLYCLQVVILPVIESIANFHRIL